MRESSSSSSSSSSSLRKEKSYATSQWPPAFIRKGPSPHRYLKASQKGKGDRHAYLDIMLAVSTVDQVDLDTQGVPSRNELLVGSGICVKRIEWERALGTQWPMFK
eukprot:1143417-Pelagomonas_calceolata.AAC.1